MRYTTGPPPPEPLSPGSSGARIHSTIRPSRIRKFVRAVPSVPEPQLLPPGPARPVKRNSALTYKPRSSAEMNRAPHGSVSLAATAWASVWIRIRASVPPGPMPLTSSLGSWKYLAAARMSPRRRSVDQASITFTAPPLAGVPVGPGAGTVSPPRPGNAMRGDACLGERIVVEPQPAATRARDASSGAAFVARPTRVMIAPATARPPGALGPWRRSACGGARMLGVCRRRSR